MNWSPADYDRLERAIADGTRVHLLRRGTRMTVVPHRLRLEFGVEILSARSLGTGDRLEIQLEEIDSFDVIE